MQREDSGRSVNGGRGARKNGPPRTLGLVPFVARLPFLLANCTTFVRDHKSRVYVIAIETRFETCHGVFAGGKHLSWESRVVLVEEDQLGYSIVSMHRYFELLAGMFGKSEGKC